MKLIILLMLPCIAFSQGWMPTTEFVYRYDKLVVDSCANLIVYRWNPANHRTTKYVIEGDTIRSCTLYRFDGSVFPPATEKLDLFLAPEYTTFVRDLHRYLEKRHENDPAFDPRRHIGGVPELLFDRDGGRARSVAQR